MYTHRFVRLATTGLGGGALSRSSRIVGHGNIKTGIKSQTRALATGRVVIVGDDDAFKKFSEKDGKKIYYFTASWCPPCKAIAPKFEALSTEYPDISFLKIDIDENPEAAGDAGIRSVPTFQFANGQSKLAEFAGADESALADNIRKLQSA